jgi:arginase family enzyme
VLALLAGVARKARIAGRGMAEFTPARDIDSQGATGAAGVAMTALGLLAA